MTQAACTLVCWEQMPTFAPSAEDLYRYTFRQEATRKLFAVIVRRPKAGLLHAGDKTLDALQAEAYELAQTFLHGANAESDSL